MHKNLLALAVMLASGVVFAEDKAARCDVLEYVDNNTKHRIKREEWEKAREIALKAEREAQAATKAKDEAEAETLRKIIVVDRNADGEPTITLHGKDLRVRSLIQVIGERVDTNLVMSDSVGGKVTVVFRETPWEEALDTILTANHLDKRGNSSGFYIAPKDDFKDIESNALRSPMYKDVDFSAAPIPLPPPEDRLGINLPQTSAPVFAAAPARTPANHVALSDFRPGVVGKAMTSVNMPQLAHNTEKYAHNDPNPVQRTADNPISTFSIDVDTGSYANVRRYLNKGTLPPADAVRLEEIVNYFSYDYALPKDGKPFAVHTQVVDSPWKEKAKLMRIALQAADWDKAELPPANLVFLIDTSGSMDSPDKIGLVQKTACHFAAELRKQDTITLITYSGYTKTLLEPTAGDQFDKIYNALETLSAQGSTAGENAIRMAYDAAEKNYKKDGINRILLATDGDFNVGVSDTNALKSMVADKRKAGISLSTLGFGSGNYNDEMMEQIADAGDGNYSYIDSLDEAKKVLVRQLSSTLATVARDVKIQIEFNPATVKEYRLVGYENRVLREEDFNNDQVDAGDIGAGHRVTAFYEFIPAGEQGWLEEKRYEKSAEPQGDSQEYAFIKLRYKPDGSDVSQLMDTPVAVQSIALDQGDEDMRFAVAAASYAQALQGGEYNGVMDWQAIKRLAEASIGKDPFKERAGLLQLIDKAQGLSKAR